MPLSIEAWECLGKMAPKHPRQVGPIVKLLGSEKSFEELIKTGHLKWTGAMIVRTAASVDAMTVFDRLPDDGASRGNTTLKRECGLTDRRYESAKKLLLRTGEVSPARGRGGALRRAADIDVGSRVGGVKQESDLYEPFKEFLESGAQPPGQTLRLCRVTASGEGYRRGTGSWTRPDVVAVTVTDWELVPGVVAEIHSYELKPYASAEKLVGVYEASGHQRRAHYSTLVLEWPIDGEREVPEEIEKECLRLGVGLALIWGSEVEPRLDAQRNSPEPNEMNEFLQDVLSREDDRTEYLQAIGRAANVDANE